MVMRLRYFTISGAQFTAFRVYNTYKSYCKFNFNMQSLEFLRLSPLCFKSGITYPWSCSLQSRWLWFPPRSFRSYVISGWWRYVCVGNRTGRGACCKLKSSKLLIERYQKFSKLFCATHRCFAIHVQHS